MEYMHMPDDLAKAAAIFSDAVDLAQDRGRPVESKIAWGMLVLCRAMEREMDDMRAEIAEIRKKLDAR